MSLANTIYVSGDEVNRSSARGHGITDVHVHPRTVAGVSEDATVLLDLDHPFFRDTPAVLRLAERFTAAGATVGVHTYYPDDPSLSALRAGGVVVARNLAQLWPALRRLRNAAAATPGSAQEVRCDHHPDAAADADLTREFAHDDTAPDLRPLGRAGRAGRPAAAAAAGA